MNDQSPSIPHSPRYWVSRHFQTSCRAHVPEPGTGAWWAGSWRAMSAPEMVGFAEAAGHAPACDACAAIEVMGTTDDAPTPKEQRDAIVARLARSLGVTHLEARGIDDADHHEVHVELLCEALEAAYDAGRGEGTPACPICDGRGARDGGDICPECDG